MREREGRRERERARERRKERDVLEQVQRKRHAPLIQGSRDTRWLNMALEKAPHSLEDQKDKGSTPELARLSTTANGTRWGRSEGLENMCGVW